MKRVQKIESRGIPLPILVERDEDGMYIVECPVLQACYSQGRTVDEALQRIHEAIDLARGDAWNKEYLSTYRPNDVSFHTVVA